MENKIEFNVLLEDNVETNSHCVNKKIKATILDDKIMKEIGFTDYCSERWHFSRGITFPKTKEYRNFEVTFGVTIPKDGSDIRIDILDEAFCQPYDYQHMIVSSREKGIRPNKTALIIFEQVELWMKYLKDKGILEGHNYGEYI